MKQRVGVADSTFLQQNIQQLNNQTEHDTAPLQGRRQDAAANINDDG